MTTTEFDQLQHAFETAANKNGREREDYLRQLALRDSHLANEVTTLLAFETEGDDPLEAACEHHQDTCAPPHAESTLPTISGYDVRRRIGSGGQAEVFLARQGSTGQDVAIKIFRGCALADSQQKRIDAETTALARLQLANVVAILDRGQTACGREYLVTRFIAGHPVDEAAARLLPENPQRVVDLFAKIADTLARVHRHGIIHRDLKPSNILVDQDDEPYLLDFGLASFFADPSGRLLTVTPDEVFQGSILWASPEQVEASFGPVDRRSDVYSLGVVLYQALTGRLPYPVEGGILDIAQQIVRTSPAPLEVSRRTTRPFSVAKFEAVVFRALAKQPHRRFQSADEFATALRQAEPLQTKIAETRTPRYPKYHLAMLCAAAAACAAFWPALNAAMFSMPEPSKPSVAEGDKEQGHSGIAIADAVRTPLLQSFDDELAPFGRVPPHWTQVGSLQNHRHEIERGKVSIEGDFVLTVQLTASRTSAAGFALSLVGTDGFDDLSISGEKVNTWSDNESWSIRTPAGTVVKGLPVAPHSFVLRRQGDLITLTADAVHLPSRSDTVLATFAAGGSNRFQAIRLITSGPAIELKRLRLHTGGGSQ